MLFLNKNAQFDNQLIDKGGRGEKEKEEEKEKDKEEGEGEGEKGGGRERGRKRKSKFVIPNGFPILSYRTMHWTCYHRLLMGQISNFNSR